MTAGNTLAPEPTFRFFVVIPFWNSPEELAGCLRSVEEQTRPAVAVLADDASDEPARRLALDWCEADANRVYLANETNQGPAAARHRALSWVLEHSRSDQDVVVLVDGDDALEHDRVLERIRAVYESDGRVRMTLGGFRRASGRPGSRRRYHAWQFRLGMMRSAPWCARHPRTFQVGLLREAWSDIVWTSPDGQWLRRATDVTLVLPMLRRLKWEELRQLEDTLYVYRDVRPDGRTMGASVRGRVGQLVAEAYVRKSALWFAVLVPRSVLIVARDQWAQRRWADPPQSGDE